MRRRKTLLGALLGAGGGAGLGALVHGGGPMQQQVMTEAHYKARLEDAAKIIEEALDKQDALKREIPRQIMSKFQEHPEKLLEYHKIFTTKVPQQLDLPLSGGLPYRKMGAT